MATRSGEFVGTERFEVMRRLGAGGMGVVYQAYDREREHIVALKTMRRGDAANLYRFKQEFRALADIRHRNLAGLHELISSGDHWFFTMEMVDGVDVITWVRGPAASETATTDGLDADAPIDLFHEEHRSAEGSWTTVESSVDSGSPPPEPSPPASYDRLIDALCQLVEGVQFLHEANKLHRDIKPSNVLVNRSGRVVLLDFGLITDVWRAGGGASDSYRVVGTVHYMSPEQGASQPLGPPSDWYSVGTVLYRALTGVLPFQGPPMAVLMEKQRVEPAPPHEILPETPEELSQLCSELLRRDPAARPDGPQILRVLGSGAGRRRRAVGSSTHDVPFVGRALHASVLRDAFSTATREGRPSVVLVHGRSGMGKSVLLERVTGELAREGGAVVLAGRCYERESLPYKALDSLIDALSRYLARLPRGEVDALMPRDVPAMARLFPVLYRLDVVKAAPRRGAAPDAHELRRRGLAALRELLSRMTDRRPLILTIDDVHWGDLDSTALLLDLLRPPEAPPVTLVLAYRSEEARTSETVRHLVEGLRASGLASEDVREVVVDLLSPEEARALALQRLERRGARRAPSLAGAIARESAGDPFLIDQLVRFAATSGEARAEVLFSQVIRAQLDQLGPEARRSLELIATAGQPLAEDLVAYAASILRREKTMSELRAASLIRTSGVPELRRVEIYHDRVRAAVVANLTDEQQREFHLALADALEESDRPDPAALVVHLLAGGAVERGTKYAIIAAERASAALAFERATVLYRLAIDALPAAEVARRRLRIALAEALVNAGRGGEAAGEFLLEAEGRPPMESLELRRRAAEQLLRAGLVDEGLRTLETVLSAVGMELAPSRRRAFWSRLWTRARVWLGRLRFAARQRRQVSAERLARVDICWSVAIGIGFIDPIRGLDFQSRHLLLALAAGEPYRVSRALAAEAGYVSLRGRASPKRTEKLIAQARSISDRIEEPLARGFIAITRGLADFHAGRWSAALSGFDAAAEMLRESSAGVADQVASARLAVDALYKLGSLAELCRRVPQHLAEAEQRGDRYGAVGMRNGLPNTVWLVMDDPATARAESALARQWFSQLLGFYLQDYYELQAQTHIDLYVGDGDAAYRRIMECWPKLVKSMLLRVHLVWTDALFMRGRAALAAASALGHASRHRSALLAEAERISRTLHRQKLPAVQADGSVLAAIAAQMRGNSSDALLLLERAEIRFTVAEMKFCAAAARYRRGQLLGGEAGEPLVAEGERWMRAQGVRNPAAMSRIAC